MKTASTLTDEALLRLELYSQAEPEAVALITEIFQDTDFYKLKSSPRMKRPRLTRDELCYVVDNWKDYLNANQSTYSASKVVRAAVRHLIARRWGGKLEVAASVDLFGFALAQAAAFYFEMRVPEHAESFLSTYPLTPESRAETIAAWNANPFSEFKNCVRDGYAGFNRLMRVPELIAAGRSYDEAALLAELENLKRFPLVAPPDIGIGIVISSFKRKFKIARHAEAEKLSELVGIFEGSTGMSDLLVGMKEADSV